MDKKEIPILSLLQQIQSGAVDPRDVDKDLRQQMVEVLLLEGTSIPQIAQMLKVGDKTIRREISTIKGKNSLSPSIELAKLLVGDLRMKAEAHRSHLMRLARAPGAKVGEKCLAEFYAWKVSVELIEKLQSLAYLPLVPHRIAAEIYHNDENDAKTLGELKDELTVIEGIAQKDGILDERLKEKVQFLKLKIEKAEIDQDVIELNKNKKEDSNEQEDK